LNNTFKAFKLSFKIIPSIFQDFGKYPHVLRFVQNYIQALNSQNEGEQVVLRFVRTLHGRSHTCPHIRVLPNLVSVCTAAINFLSEQQKKADINDSVNELDEDETDSHMTCYLSLLQLMLVPTKLHTYGQL